MTQLTLQIPDPLAERLAQLAARQKKSMEQVALELLAVEQSVESPEERYHRLLDESGLFVKISEEEKRLYQPVSEERRKELADKVGAAGPLSQVIIEERGPK
jgi:predicted transcriptional regulator